MPPVPDPKTETKNSPKNAAPKAPKAPKTERPAQPEQNGVTRPRAGTSCATLWEIADKALKANRGVCPVRAEVLAEAIEAGVAPGTASTQFAAWREFNGLVGELAGKRGKAASEEKPVSKKPAAPAKKPAAPKAPPPPAAPAR